jgi:iron-sulfur cluster insertion protein
MTDHVIETPKIPLVLTDAAAYKIAELMLEENDLSLKLRVYIEGGGCSGFKYGFDFIEALDPDDLSLSQDVVVTLAAGESTQAVQVTLVIDPMSLQYLSGAEIDYKKDLEGERFIIRNPNAQTTCGCGSSFSVE